MGLCAADCVDYEQVGNPTAGCDLGKRLATLSRILFLQCNVTLPSQFTTATVQPLFTAKTIVASQPLADVTLADPETQELIIHDCAPPEQYATRRILTANDKIAVRIAAVPGSPGTPANNYFDYDFWKDKVQHRLLLRYGLLYCNGDVILARDESGNLAEATLNAFLSYEKLQNNAGTLEFKKITLAFQGDPIAFRRPDFNVNELGITF